MPAAGEPSGRTTRPRIVSFRTSFVVTGSNRPSSTVTRRLAYSWSTGQNWSRSFEGGSQSNVAMPSLPVAAMRTRLGTLTSLRRPSLWMSQMEKPIPERGLPSPSTALMRAARRHPA